MTTRGAVNNMDQNLFRLVEEIAFTAINYIIVSSISNSQSKQTITDLKTDLTTVKAQLLSEIKQQGDGIVGQIKESEKKE